MAYKLRIMTPSKSLETEVDSVRAEDGSGSFGILGHHQDFLTALRPCILILRTGEKESFAAVDGGILRVEKGELTIASRQLMQSEDLACLKDAIVSSFRRDEEKEATFMDLLNNMEKLLVDNLVKYSKG
ncbi:MAG TPA: F0F1 ATP synthase subunit epsilon [Nitrospirota bacterium]